MGLVQLTAAAFEVVCIRAAGGRLQSQLLGGRGVLIRQARSAFHAEVSALDLAIEFLNKLASTLPPKRCDRSAKRIRFEQGQAI